MIKCEWCGKEITKRNAKKYCCKQCEGAARGYNHYQQYLKDNTIASGIKNMNCYKKYILSEQDCKCAICNQSNIWNKKELVFVLDHINGNADDNSRSNLRLICPNCDSQLSTFKSKNKHSARSKYRQYKTQAELIIRNNNNVDDDNVESLTGNADGNDVGMD